MKLLVLCNMMMHRAKVTLQNNNNMSSCFCFFVDNYYNWNCVSVVVFVVFYYYSFSCLYLPSFYYFHHCIIIAFCCHHSLDRCLLDVGMAGWLSWGSILQWLLYVWQPMFSKNRRLSYAPHTYQYQYATTNDVALCNIIVCNEYCMV